MSLSAPTRWRRYNLLAVITVVMAVSISIIAVSYYISSTAPRPEPTHTRSFTFLIRTVLQGVGNYVVRLPLVIPSNATPTPDSVNEMVLDSMTGGQGEIVSTEHGYAFEFESDTAIQAQITFTKRVNSSVPTDYYKLSMCSGQCGEARRTFDYHAYLQSVNITSLSVVEELTIHNPGAYYGGSSSYLCTGQLTGGWQSLEGSYVVSPGPVP
jgi:hypothetical protein